MEEGRRVRGRAREEAGEAAEVARVMEGMLDKVEKLANLPVP